MGNKVGVVKEINIQITIAVLLAVLSVAAILGFISWPSIRDELVFAAAITGGAAAIYSAYYIGATLRLSIIKEKQKMSYAILDHFNRVDINIIRSTIDSLSSQQLSQKDVYERIVADHELHSSVRLLLGLIEDMSIAIRKDVVDEEILYISLSFVVPWTFSHLSSYIKEFRERYRVPSIYIETQRLAEAWNTGRSLIDGRRFEPLL